MKTLPFFSAHFLKSTFRILQEQDTTTVQRYDAHAFVSTLNRIQQGLRAHALHLCIVAVAYGLSISPPTHALRKRAFFVSMKPPRATRSSSVYLLKRDVYVGAPWHFRLCCLIVCQVWNNHSVLCWIRLCVLSLVREDSLYLTSGDCRVILLRHMRWWVLNR